METTTVDAGANLRYYLRIVARRKATIVASVVVALLAAIAVSFLVQTKTYQADTEVLVEPGIGDLLGGDSVAALYNRQRNLENDVRFIESSSVEQDAAARLGFEASVSASASPTADIITITATDSDPERAAQIASTFAQSYIAIRQDQRIDELNTTAEVIEEQIAGLQQQRDALPPENVGEAAGIDRAIVDLNDTLQRARASGDLTERGGPQVTQEAEVPGSPIEPNLPRNLGAGIVLGLLAGVGLGFLRDRLDDSIRTKDDLALSTRGAPVLGLIPQVEGWKERSEAKLVSLRETNSPAAEAYRALRTSVQFLGVEDELKSLAITSPGAREGKSTTLANLAVTLAKTGKQVIVVDCDLRRPRIHEFYGCSNNVGLTSVLLGDTPLAKAIQAVPEQARLRLLASGPLPPNPSEVLSMRRVANLVDALEAEADIVLIDCPPILPVTDALLVSRFVDAIVLVASARTTSKRQLIRAVEMLGQVDAPFVGSTLNVVSGEEEGYGYVYGHGYSSLPGFGTNGSKRGGRLRRLTGSPSPADDDEDLGTQVPR